MNAETKLTKHQRCVLAETKRLNDAGGTAHINWLRTNRGVMERLEKHGLIESARPFSFAYHSVTITDAGRAALLKTGG